MPPSDIHSIFESVSQSDTNAHVVLSILAEDYNLSQIKNDDVSLYLHAVYSDRPQVINLLLDNDVDTQCTTTGNFTGEPYKENSTRTFEGAHDICLAVLSPEKDALKNLLDIHRERSIKSNINHNEAIPFSQQNLSRSDAKKHTALDLAVMQYVATSLEKREDEQDMSQFEKEINAEFGPVLEEFNQMIGSPPAEQYENNVFKDEQKSQLAKIELLFCHGAQGSEASYFPASKDSLLAPFMNSDAFEIMSLKDFCTNSKNLFPANIYEFIMQQDHPVPPKSFDIT